MDNKNKTNRIISRAIDEIISTGKMKDQTAEKLFNEVLTTDDLEELTKQLIDKANTKANEVDNEDTDSCKVPEKRKAGRPKGSKNSRRQLVFQKKKV